MLKVLQRVEITLRSFYIFNSSLSKKEGDEHKKILYYHPNDIEENTKIKDVGLSEAIIAFTETFTSNNDCEALHTQKTTQLFYQPEDGYWLVMVLNVPKEIRMKDGIEVTDYRGGEVNDGIYRNILIQCYRMFRLFAGTFQMNYDFGGTNDDIAREQLQQTLKLFFDKYLLTLKLPACDILEAMCSLQYLPLEKSLFLRTHNFINMIRATFASINEIIYFYNDQVVCSGKIDANDLYSLHEYIVGTLLSEITQTEQDSTVFPCSTSISSNMYLNGSYITGPEDDENVKKPPKVYLLKDNKLSAYHLVVYRTLNTTLCLFINGNETLPNDFYTELHSYMGPQLSSIARDIAEELSQHLKKNSIQSTAALASNNESDVITPKYLFLNEQSLKHLSNIIVDKRRPKTNQSIPLNVLNIIGNLINKSESNTSTSTSFEEIFLKTTNDFWIVKRKCNWRQYFVIVFNSKATLLDITQEAKRIFEQELTDDVFFDK